MGLRRVLLNDLDVTLHIGQVKYLRVFEVVRARLGCERLYLLMRSCRVIISNEVYFSGTPCTTTDIGERNQCQRNGNGFTRVRSKADI